MEQQMTMIDKAEALLPCPFCGGEAELWNARDNRLAWIACMGRCAVLISKEHATDAEAIAAWNRRAAPTDAAQARECCDLCGSDVTDMDGHLVHDEGCNGDTYAPAAQAREAAQLDFVTLLTDAAAVAMKSREAALREAAGVAEAILKQDAKAAEPHDTAIASDRWDYAEQIPSAILALIGSHT